MVRIVVHMVDNDLENLRQYGEVLFHDEKLHFVALQIEHESVISTIESLPNVSEVEEDRTVSFLRDDH